MTKLLALLLACLALGLVVAGCGGDDDDDSNGGGAAAATTEQPADTGGGAGGGGAEVSMENIQFNPNDVTVNAGDTITFTNKESVPHDVHKTSGPGDDFASGPAGGMQEGDTFELKLDQPGKYEYVCDVHAPGMTGSITVK
jgi:plastocyanin